MSDNILCDRGLVIAMVVSFLYIVIMRWVAGPMVWITIFLFVGLFGFGEYKLFTVVAINMLSTTIVCCTPVNIKKREFLEYDISYMTMHRSCFNLLSGSHSGSDNVHHNIKSLSHIGPLHLSIKID